jgi:hypothetical protein
MMLLIDSTTIDQREVNRYKKSSDLERKRLSMEPKVVTRV